MNILKEILIGILGYMAFFVTILFFGYLLYLLLRLLFGDLHTANAGWDIDVLRDIGWGFWERT